MFVGGVDSQIFLELAQTRVPGYFLDGTQRDAGAAHIRQTGATKTVRRRIFQAQPVEGVAQYVMSAHSLDVTGARVFGTERARSPCPGPCDSAKDGRAILDGLGCRYKLQTWFFAG